MAIAIWPSSVNQNAVRGSYREVPDQNVAQFSPDVGPPKLRRRSSISTDKLAFDIVMTSAEYAAFLSFWRSDIKDGTLPFAFTRPRTQAVEAFNFTQPPQIQDFAFGRYQVSLALQQAPGYDGVNLQNGNDQYTKILHHMEGANGGTIFTDSAYGQTGARAWTPNNSVNTATAIAKFGLSAGGFDGVSGYIDTPDHPDLALGSGDWTIDYWFDITGGGTAQMLICGQCDNAATTSTISFYMERQSATKVIRAFVCVGGSAFACVGTTQFTNAINTGLHHCALVRTGNSMKLFVDGTQEGSTTAVTGTINDSANKFAIGRAGEIAANTFGGYIDEFRLSVGIARWTAAFTPPTAAYS